MQDWMADDGGWEEGGDNVKYSFFSMTKAVEALHNRGIVHRCILSSFTPFDSVVLLLTSILLQTVLLTLKRCAYQRVLQPVKLLSHTT